MMTAVDRLSSHGYVRVLWTSSGQQQILLAPELLNNLAASFILEARRNSKGLGALEEQRVRLVHADLVREVQPGEPPQHLHAGLPRLPGGDVAAASGRSRLAAAA